MLAGRKKMMGFAPNISRNISLFFSDPSMGVNYSRNGCFSSEEKEKEEERRDFDQRYRFAFISALESGHVIMIIS